MALSTQRVPIRNLVAAKTYAKRIGLQVGESLPETKVHQVHVKGSWHYLWALYKLRRHSKAADFNYGAPGANPSERSRAARLVKVAESMGLAVRYSLRGHVTGHDDHAHLDVGDWSNLGHGEYHPPKGDLVVWDTQAKVRAALDNLCEDDTRRRLNAVKEASVYGGTDFPHGIPYTQRVIGTAPDGDWGPKSRKALAATTKSLQTLWKACGLYRGKLDGVWGPLMQAALVAFLKKYGR